LLLTFVAPLADTAEFYQYQDYGEPFAKANSMQAVVCFMTDNWDTRPYVYALVTCDDLVPRCDFIPIEAIIGFWLYHDNSSAIKQPPGGHRVGSCLAKDGLDVVVHHDFYKGLWCRACPTGFWCKASAEPGNLPGTCIPE